MSSLADKDQRSNVIASITTPLSFMVLSLLVVESLLGAMAYAFPEHRKLLVWSIIIFLPVFTFLVVGLAVWRPEALSGSRPWQTNLAQRFADDLYVSLDGSLSNLSLTDQEEAWSTVAEVIISDNEAGKDYSAFCRTVGNRLKQRANLKGKLSQPRGTLST
ncbi:MAG TPA: hypothetical protein VJ842_15525 [Pyrinomonadaceae bacterium]|nr:hypothetical protein [Pyrinomonadaceae bacterium]